MSAEMMAVLGVTALVSGGILGALIGIGFRLSDIHRDMIKVDYELNRIANSLETSAVTELWADGRDHQTLPLEGQR